MARRAPAGAAARGTYRRKKLTTEPTAPGRRVQVGYRTTIQERDELLADAKRRGMSLNGYLCWLLERRSIVEAAHPLPAEQESLPLSA